MTLPTVPMAVVPPLSNAGISCCHPQAIQLRPQLTELVQTLQRELQAMPGVWVEDKGLARDAIDADAFQALS